MMALQAVVSATVWVAGGLRAMERAAARDIWSEAYAALTICITNAREMTRTVIPSADSIATEPRCLRPEAARRAAQTHRAGQPSSVTKRWHARYAITSEPDVRNSNVHSTTAIRNLRQSSQHRLSAWIGHDSANNTSSLRMNKNEQ